MQYIAPHSLEDAVKALAEMPDARILAGGTDLLVRMRSDMADPDAAPVGADMSGDVRNAEDRTAFQVAFGRTPGHSGIFAGIRAVGAGRIILGVR